MYQIVLFIHVVIAIAIIVMVLLQQGKGATIGAAFGSGASNTVFGSQGTGSFLLKVTGALAAAFFVTSISLGAIASNEAKKAQEVALPSSSPVQTAPAKPLSDKTSPSVPEKK